MSLHCYSTMILQFTILMDNHKAGFSVVRSIILICNCNRGPLQNIFCINLRSSYKEQLGFKSSQNSYLAGSQEQEHLPFSYLVLTFPFITSLSPHSKYCIPHSKYYIPLPCSRSQLGLLSSNLDQPFVISKWRNLLGNLCICELLT